jgi:hypothetical protein
VSDSLFVAVEKRLHLLETYSAVGGASTLLTVLPFEAVLSKRRRRRSKKKKKREASWPIPPRCNLQRMP